MLLSSGKKMIIGILVLILGLVLFMAILSIISHKTPSVGMVGGRLRPCSDRPNCVCSEYEALPSYVKPLEMSEYAQSDWEKARRIVCEMGGKIVHEDDSYLWATFSTRIFRFVDDLELRMDRENGVVHVRSGSRVGYSDMGMNRNRVEVLRSKFNRSK